jgi:molybdopterin molybdotransferase
MTDFCATQGLLTLEQALAQISDNLPENNAYERLSLKNSLNRITFTDITSGINIPSFRNSSMDGYALQSHDQQKDTLKVVGTSWAGKPFTRAVNEGECIRIFTGAYVPDDCDCVVMQENVSRIEETIKISAWPKQEENIRNIADDTQKGQVLLTKGKQLKPADIGLLAACGIADVAVYKAITVGFFSTGDELVSMGSQLKLGQIFDSNRYTLHALLTEAGVTPVDMGVIPDNPSAVEAALLSASRDCDVIITTGGVSVGEADFITDVLEKIGTVDLWKIAIKPGKPLIFGHIDKAAFFGLPGNPVSVMVTFQQIVIPALQKMMGYKKLQQAVTLQARTTETIKKQPGRIEFQRGLVENNKGELIVRSTGGQGSHMLSSMSKANCLIVLDQTSGDVEKGQYVSIQLLGKNI